MTLIHSPVPPPQSNQRGFQTTFRRPSPAFWLRLLLMMALLGSLGLQVSAEVQTASLLVNTLDDTFTTTDFKCSLREAIVAANNNVNQNNCVRVGSGNTDTITFDAALSGGVIVLNTNLPAITDSAGLTIDGTDRAITISGNNSVRILQINSGAELILRNLTLRDANSIGDGGAILNNGVLTIENSTLSNNHASNDGGAVSNNTTGTILISNSVLSNNSAENGGAILNGGILNIVDSSLGGNSAEVDSGGAIFNNGSCIITNSTLAENFAFSSGGSVYNGVTGDIVIQGGSVINDNVADNGSGGGLINLGQASITDSTISHNSSGDRGGAIFNAAGSGGFGPAHLTIERSTLRENVAGLGGGMANSGDLTMIDSTIATNTGILGGGGIFNNSALSISNSTVSGNATNGSGGGISVSGGVSTLTYLTITGNTANADNDSDGLGGGLFTSDSPTIVLSNSIVAGNREGNGTTASSDCSSVTGMTTSFNLVGTGTGCPSAGAGDQTTTDPKLGPLSDNGGPTLTHALLSGSPAIDQIPQGINECGAGVTVDQRGEPRPVDGDGNGQAQCDKGAYEAPAGTSPSPTSPPTNTPTATPSATAMPSVTATPSATAMPSVTATPSATAMPSVTAPPSATPIPSPTATPPFSSNSPVFLPFVIKH